MYCYNLWRITNTLGQTEITTVTVRSEMSTALYFMMSQILTKLCHSLVYSHYNTMTTCLLATNDYISSFCTYIMGELVWHEPCNELSHHLSLVIYSLDGEENLSGANKLAEVNELIPIWSLLIMLMSNKQAV